MQKFIPYAIYAAVAAAGFIIGRVTAPDEKNDK